MEVNIQSLFHTLKVMISRYISFNFRLKQSESDKVAAEETARKLGQTVADKDSKR